MSVNITTLSKLSNIMYGLSVNSCSFCNLDFPTHYASKVGRRGRVNTLIVWAPPPSSHSPSAQIIIIALCSSGISVDTQYFPWNLYLLSLSLSLSISISLCYHVVIIHQINRLQRRTIKSKREQKHDFFSFTIIGVIEVEKNQKTVGLTALTRSQFWNPSGQFLTGSELRQTS